MVREALTSERLGAMDPSEAAALLVARRAEGLTAGEEELLAAWIAADPHHAREFERAAAALDWFDGARDHEVLAAMRAHALAPRPAGVARWRPAAAAALLLMLAAAGLLVAISRGWWGGSGSEAPGTVRTIEYVSAPRQVRQVALPDGSRMTLDAASRARGPAAAGARSIELIEGRAFFDVASDPSRAFSVTAGDRRILALGTRFDVDLANGALSVTLLDGRITVGPLDDSAAPVTLAPGQRFVERGGSAAVRRVEGADLAASWRTGLLQFDDATLEEAAAEINRYAADRIVIRDPAVAAMRISGAFQAGDASRFAAAVAELRPVRAVRRQGEVELVAR